MLKAAAIQAPGFAICIALCFVLPPVWAAVATTAIILTMTAFFTYAIVHPASHFFARVVDRLATDEQQVALTFDDGPDPVYTAKVLDTLREHNARATFFVLGERARAHPQLIRRMHDEGHTVGTHTHRHLIRFHFGSPTYVRREIEEAIEAVGAILPERPTLFRPPQGLRTPCFASGWARLRGLTLVTWSVRGFDSRPTTAEAIVARIGKHLAPGAIVTLHDGTGLGGGTNREPTLAALARILAECKTRGLRCVALSEVGTAVR